MKKWLHLAAAGTLAVTLLSGCAYPVPAAPAAIPAEQGAPSSQEALAEPETAAAPKETETEQAAKENVQEAAGADEAADKAAVTGNEAKQAVEPAPAEEHVFTEPAEEETGLVEEGVFMAAMAAAPTMDMAAEEEYWYPEEPDWNTEEYDYFAENSFRSVRTSPFSTFAADVDTASYANIRRMIFDDDNVYPDAVRIEEMINYFHYDYPQPEEGEPFSVTTEIAPCPWNEDTDLLLIGLQAKNLDTEDMPQSNLVFLIDVSGSMDTKDKLPLVQRSFMTLVENLDERDKVSIVTYSSGERIVLDGAPASGKAEIMDAIEGLYASGSTNGERAINIAYELAEKNYIKGGNNRVIMATDGDFNVGITSEGELTRLIREKAKEGVFLSVLGYGMGNYKDNKLEAMADNGNGNYAYIDTIDEARKVLVGEAGGTLFTVAKDVKLQVEFNPEAVKGYRLIGYENRTMAAEDFADDTKDGGEIGAGHQVTALYEIVPVTSEFNVSAATSKYSKNNDTFIKDMNEFDGEWLTVNIRYKEPDEEESSLLEYPVTGDSRRDEMSDNMNWAAGVAQVGMLLKESEYAGTSDYDEIRDRLRPIADDDFKEEFIYMIRKIR